MLSMAPKLYFLNFDLDWNIARFISSISYKYANIFAF